MASRLAAHLNLHEQVVLCRASIDSQHVYRGPRVFCDSGEHIVDLECDALEHRAHDVPLI